MQIVEFVKLARPSHWIKNAVVFLPVFSSKHMGDKNAWLAAFAAAVAFCFASSFAYILNDIKDRKADSRHPNKKDRPLARETVSLTAALAEAFCFLAAAVAISLGVSMVLFFVIALYLALQILYSTWLKQKPLIDVICIALGFVLRASAGAVAIKVILSPWLFICMFTICLFMGFCKRYNETVTLANAEKAEDHRSTLIAYTPDLLTHLITLSAGIAVVVFLFYGLNPSTVERFGTHFLIYTLPIVVYGVFRFAMLSMRGVYSDPTDLILHDKPFQATVGIWIIMALSIILYGVSLKEWLTGLV